MIDFYAIASIFSGASKYINNEIEHKNTFENRTLSTVPKYILKRMSTSINENEEKSLNMSTLKNDN